MIRKRMIVPLLLLILMAAWPTHMSAQVNIALGKTVQLIGANFFYEYSQQTGVSPQTITDGIFLRRYSDWNGGTVWWLRNHCVDDGKPCSIEIELGDVYRIDGFIFQGDADLDEFYALEFWDLEAMSWQMAWEVPGVAGGHVQTRPNPADDTEIYPLVESVITNRLRARPLQDNWNAISEIQAYGELFCVDADGDGYGVGGACAGPDVNDAASSCTTDGSTDSDSDGVADCLDLCGDVDQDDFGTNWYNLVIGEGAAQVGDCTTDGTTMCNFGDAQCIWLDTNDAASSCTTDSAGDLDGDGVEDCLDICGDVDKDGYGNDRSALVVGEGSIQIGNCTTNGSTACTYGDSFCIAADSDDAASSCTTDGSTDMDGDGVPDCLDACGDGDGDEFGTDWIKAVVGAGAAQVGSCTTDGVNACVLGDDACFGLDCDDDDPKEFPGQTWYPDCDSDTFMSDNFQTACSVEEANLSPVACVDGESPDGGWALVPGKDCNDEDTSVNPDAWELTGDGIDQDCDSSDVNPETDTDNDTVLDRIEDRNNDGNPNNDNTDADGVADYLDTDDDNDSIPTFDEDPDADNDPTNDDSDDDGLPDYLDPDDDNDNVPTADEDPDKDGNPLNDDTDDDLLPNYRDSDDDGDGLLTINEDPNGNNDPTDDDSDKDSIPDYLDADSPGIVIFHDGFETIPVALCGVCQSDNQCLGPTDRCVAFDDGSNCAQDCSEGNPHGTLPYQCDGGFTCTNFAPDVWQCVPVTNSCTCTGENADEQRLCTRSNSFGTCEGVETCTVVGWTPCSAPTPTPDGCT